MKKESKTDAICNDMDKLICYFNFINVHNQIYILCLTLSAHTIALTCMNAAWICALITLMLSIIQIVIWIKAMAFNIQTEYIYPRHRSNGMRQRIPMKSMEVIIEQIINFVLGNSLQYIYCAVCVCYAAGHFLSFNFNTIKRFNSEINQIEI